MTKDGKLVDSTLTAKAVGKVVDEDELNTPDPDPEVAKAMLVDFDKLKKAQDKADPVMADKLLMDAFNTDVRPIINKYKEHKNLPVDPVLEWRKMK